MESLKPILLFIVLSGVGYAVYIALNHSPPEQSISGGPDWSKPVPGASANANKSNDSRPNAPFGMPSSSPMSASPWVVAPSANTDGTQSPGPNAATQSADLPADGQPRDTTQGFSASDSRSAPNGLPVADPFAQNPQGSSIAQAGNSIGATYRDAPSFPPTTNSPGPISTGRTSDSPTGAPAGSNLSPGSAIPNAQTRHDYESSMRSGQTRLKQGKLVEALREFSRWYDHPAVSPDDQAILNDLLGQVSGTVIYSREHWLAPPYVVKAGDTLETVAQQYQVPWQLLAKINGVENPNALLPGDKLKVLRGPFQAQLNRQRDAITLFVDGLYASRFKVEGGRDIVKPDGEYAVAKFAAENPTNVAHLPYISFGGDLHLTISDGPIPPIAGTLRMTKHDMDDLFDILSERSQFTVRK